MKPKHLPSYLGWFMLDRFYHQRKLDLFLHFLSFVAEVCPPTYKKEFQLPVAAMSRMGAQLTTDDDDDFMK